MSNINIAHAQKVLMQAQIIPSGTISVNGLTCREYFNLHGTLPENVIEELIEIFEGKAVATKVTLSDIKSELKHVRSEIENASYELNEIERTIRRLES